MSKHFEFTFTRRCLLIYEDDDTGYPIAICLFRRRSRKSGEVRYRWEIWLYHPTRRRLIRHVRKFGLVKSVRVRYTRRSDATRNILIEAHYGVTIDEQTIERCFPAYKYRVLIRHALETIRKWLCAQIDRLDAHILECIDYNYPGLLEGAELESGVSFHSQNYEEGWLDVVAYRISRDGKIKRRYKLAEEYISECPEFELTCEL